MWSLGSESTDSVAETAQEATESVTGEDAPKTHSTSFKLARALFGGVLAFTAVDNFRDLESMIGYAESKGAPMADRSVPAISGSLLFGGLGVAAWKLPRLAAGAIATFLVSTTPVMHDFWSMDDGQEREQQMVHFLKNTALLGGALAFLRVAQDD
ncbi:DoxX family protein [Halorussus limi]|uniref:DoxX family protein n=1 Tax=Halorussus limi TaxID=2938695 RepID=A0A8U0HQT4_9EURY|nr:DoxX family protein [Halorussus limi]UPV73405.1 DoxX family protein [Halorussus limi]